MEWFVIEKAISSKKGQQILKVRAEGKLTFIIWAKSNQSIEVDYMLTPVIDGYIANHNKAHFVNILKAKPFLPSEWQALNTREHPLTNISKPLNTIPTK
jgi:signal transduction protein PmrD